MFSIDEAITQKETELEELLIGLNNPSINQIVVDLKALKRSQEILSGLGNRVVPPTVSKPANEYPVVKNGLPSKVSATPQKYATVGDAAAGILRESGKALSISQLYDEVTKYGFNSSRKAFRTLLTKDRRKRFDAAGNALIKLNDHPLVGSSKSNGSSNGVLANFGFSLKGAITELLPEFNGEFSRPMVSDLLAQRHPQVAPHIQKASVSTTLQVLVTNGLIRETYKGFGSEPKRYEVIRAEVASPTQGQLITMHN